MANCKKCGSSNIDFSAQGFSKKTNKNFTGPKCLACNAWNFELQQQNGSAPAPAPGPQAAQPYQRNATEEHLLRIALSLERIAAALEKRLGSKPAAQEPDPEPPPPARSW